MRGSPSRAVSSTPAVKSAAPSWSVWTWQRARFASDCSAIPDGVPLHLGYLEARFTNATFWTISDALAETAASPHLGLAIARAPPIGGRRSPASSPRHLHTLAAAPTNGRRKFPLAPVDAARAVQSTSFHQVAVRHAPGLRDWIERCAESSAISGRCLHDCECPPSFHRRGVSL